MIWAFSALLELLWAFPVAPVSRFPLSRFSYLMSWFQTILAREDIELTITKIEVLVSFHKFIQLIQPHFVCMFIILECNCLMVHRVLELLGDPRSILQSRVPTSEIFIPKLMECQSTDIDGFIRLTLHISTNQCSTPSNGGHECILAGAASHLLSNAWE